MTITLVYKNMKLLLIAILLKTYSSRKTFSAKKMFEDTFFFPVLFPTLYINSLIVLIGAYDLTPPRKSEIYRSAAPAPALPCLATCRFPTVTVTVAVTGAAVMPVVAVVAVLAGDGGGSAGGAGGTTIGSLLGGNVRRWPPIGRGDRRFASGFTATHDHCRRRNVLVDVFVFSIVVGTAVGRRQQRWFFVLQYDRRLVADLRLLVQLVLEYHRDALGAERFPFLVGTKFHLAGEPPPVENARDYECYQQHRQDYHSWKHEGEQVVILGDRRRKGLLRFVCNVDGSVEALAGAHWD